MIRVTKTNLVHLEYNDGDTVDVSIKNKNGGISSATLSVNDIIILLQDKQKQ